MFNRIFSVIFIGILALQTSGFTMANTTDLKIEITQEGSGAVAENGMSVSVHYTGKLTDGTKFDSSLDRGTPFSFTLGQGRVIKGWDQGVLGMMVGEKAHTHHSLRIRLRQCWCWSVNTTKCNLNF